MLDAAITSTKKNNAQSGLDNAQIELDRYIDTLKKNKTFIEGYEYLNTGNIDDGIKGMKILDNQVQTSSDNITTTLQNSYSDQNYAYKGYSYAMQKDAAFLDETLEQWGEEHSVNMVNQQEATNEILLNNQEETNAATQTNQKTSNAAVESNDRSHWGTLISQQDTNSSTYKNNNQSWLNNLFGVKQAYAADIETEEDTMWTDVNSTNKTQSEEYATQTGIAAQEASDNFTTKGTSLIEKAVVALMSKMPGYGNNTAKSYGEKLANTLKGSGPGGVLKMISDALSKIKDLFKSHSPPKVGPLKEIDVWGENLGKTWAESFVDGMEQGMSEAEDFLDKEGQRLLAASQASTLMGSGYSGSANSYAYNNTFNFNVPTASPYEIERAARKAMYIRR